jgi:D-arabinose 1-dehydrogenase-like Zn-dependent alcohol dehydrogenase
MKGRIAVLTKYNADFQLREYPLPEVEPDAILVKVTRAGLCGSDLHIWRGELQELFGAPDRGQTFGHEMCGVVERLGRNVKTDSTGQPLTEGERVTSCYFYPCGRCPACLDGVRAASPTSGVGRATPMIRLILLALMRTITTSVLATLSTRCRRPSLTMSRLP